MYMSMVKELQCTWYKTILKSISVSPASYLISRDYEKPPNALT